MVYLQLIIVFFFFSGMIILPGGYQGIGLSQKRINVVKR